MCCDNLSFPSRDPRPVPLGHHRAVWLQSKDYWAGDPSLEGCDDAEYLVKLGAHIGNKPIIGWHVPTRMPTTRQ